MNETIHLVSFNVPYPPDYGGVADVYYKIKALHLIGVEVILHCFDYGRGKQDKLNEICKEIHYYPRSRKPFALLSPKPFIVKSRENTQLLQHLCKDKYPIVFEGLHCCFYLSNPKLKNRIKIVRTHNIEHRYYQNLFHSSKSFIKKAYFKQESLKLQAFEPVLSHANALLCISESDQKYFQTKFQKAYYIQAFHGNEFVLSQKGRGDYCLFHADLSTAENQQTAIYLAKIFSKLPYRLIIAGREPSKEVLTLKRNNIDIKANLAHKQMSKLIENAHIQLLFVKHSAGMKLKLLNSLFQGRFCLANQAMLHGSGLENLCVLANSRKQIVEEINRLMHTDFDFAEIEKRKELLETQFSDIKNAQNFFDILATLNLQTQ